MKKYIAFDTRKQEKKIIKSSKGLITGAVRGKSILLMLSTQEDIWIKKNPQVFFFGIPIKDKSFQQSASTVSNKESVSFLTKSL